MALVKVSFNIDEELIRKVDKFAEGKYINRSSALCVLLSSALKNDNLSDMLFESIKEMKTPIVFNISDEKQHNEDNK